MCVSFVFDFKGLASNLTLQVEYLELMIPSMHTMHLCLYEATLFLSVSYVSWDGKHDICVTNAMLYQVHYLIELPRVFLLQCLYRGKELYAFL